MIIITIGAEIHKNKESNNFMHNYIQMNTILTQIAILNTFIKSDISILHLTPGPPADLNWFHLLILLSKYVAKHNMQKYLVR